MYKKTILGRKIRSCGRSRTGANSPARTCFCVFLQSDLIYFDIPQRKKLIHWSNEGNSDSDHSWYIGVFVRANARSCVSERICDVFLIKIVLYTRMHQVSRWLFLKTHNANGLKCCCNGLILSSHVQDRPLWPVLLYSSHHVFISMKTCFLLLSLVFFHFDFQIRWNLFSWILLSGDETFVFVRRIWEISMFLCLESWMLNVFALSCF